jgi:DNA-binding NarL/FixJ family response regulator
MKVFIADDSKIVCERLTEMLSEVPEVEIIGQAHKALEAMQSIEKMKPDAVILDIRMPGGNGIDVLREIKKEKKAPVVIMLTNYPYPQYRKKCMDAGVDFFFDKSNEFEKVVGVLTNLIRSSIE